MMVDTGCVVGGGRQGGTSESEEWKRTFREDGMGNWFRFEGVDLDWIED
jgi:hypothetical protein